MSSKKRTAIITGSNRGLGKAILTKFANEGYNIVAHARNETQDFEIELDKLASENAVTITPVYFDITDSEAMKSAVRNLIKNDSSIEILVNNAGIAHGGYLQMTTMKTIRDVFDVNFFSMLELTQLVSKQMIRKKSGSIVNIASIAGIDATPGNCAYGVSKSAVIAATKTLAVELAPYNIRVNAVAPGLLNTDMASIMGNIARDDMISRSHMHRLGNPEEIANVVAFLVSKEASFINGQIIRVDGGM